MEIIVIVVAQYIIKEILKFDSDKLLWHYFDAPELQCGNWKVLVFRNPFNLSVLLWWWSEWNHKAESCCCWMICCAWSICFLWTTCFQIWNPLELQASRCCWSLKMPSFPSAAPLWTISWLFCWSSTWPRAFRWRPRKQQGLFQILSHKTHLARSASPKNRLRCFRQPTNKKNNQSGMFVIGGKLTLHTPPPRFSSHHFLFRLSSSPEAWSLSIAVLNFLR